MVDDRTRAFDRGLSQARMEAAAAIAVAHAEAARLISRAWSLSTADSSVAEEDAGCDPDGEEQPGGDPDSKVTPESVAPVDGVAVLGLYEAADADDDPAPLLAGAPWRDEEPPFDPPGDLPSRDLRPEPAVLEPAPPEPEAVARAMVPASASPVAVPPVTLTLDADAFARAIAAAVAAAADKRPVVLPLDRPWWAQPAMAPPPPRTSFWANAWHADVLLWVVAIVIAFVVLLAWIA
jgi:hypothetical protein